MASMSINDDLDANDVPFTVSKNSSICIKDILCESINLQKRHGMSNACGFVNIVLWKCFSIADVPVDIVYGQLELEGTVLPHVWLEMYGINIDNTYVEDIPEQALTEIKRRCVYTKTDSMFSGKLFLGDSMTQGKGITNHDVTAFRWMLSNRDNMILLSQNKTPMKRYYQDMLRFLKYNLEISELPDIENASCWMCKKSGIHLKSCGKCAVAKYCGKKCQRLDWFMIHKRICICAHKG